MTRNCPICGERANQVFRVGDLVLATRDHSVTWRGAPVKRVSPTGFEILMLMMADPGRRWSPEQIIGLLDPYGMRELTVKCLHVHMARLRKALDSSVLIRGRPWHGYWIEQI